MSEVKLQGFATRAEERMPVPDFTELEGRGRALRRRRRAATAAGVAAACVLAAVGVVMLRDSSPRAVEPVKPPDDTSVQAMDYPGAQMTDLDPGTYSMIPSWDPDYPLATITLPRGWNAWEGPNRFDNLDDPDSADAPGRGPWYAGVLILKVDGVASERCRTPGSGDRIGSSTESLVRAIRRIPGYRITETAEPVDRFGHPSTHFRLVPEGRTATCDKNLFDTATNGIIGGTDGTEDVWVVDVDGYPVLIDSQLSGKVPPAVQRQLSAAVDSIEFHFED